MLINVLKLTESEILNTEVVSGQVLYSTDTKKVYYDNIDNTRMITTSIIPLSTELTRENYVSPMPDKIYLVLTSCNLYKYAGEWIRITEVSQITEILFESTMLVPIIMNENGVDVAPATVASNVFTENGENVEALLYNLVRAYSDSNKLKLETKTINVTASSIRVEIPFPIENE